MTSQSFFIEMMRLCDEQIANGDYVTLSRVCDDDCTIERIQCFNGIVFTREIYANHAQAVEQSDEDNSEDIEDTDAKDTA